MFFTADDGIHGAELWTSDGTEAGTVLVKDIQPPPAAAASVALTSVGAKLFFAADDGTHGAELWTSDGTKAGTVLVKDVTPNVPPGDSEYSEYGLNSLTGVGGRLFFAADDGTYGSELWTSRGTKARHSQGQGHQQGWQVRCRHTRNDQLQKRHPESEGRHRRGRKAARRSRSRFVDPEIGRTPARGWLHPGHLDADRGGNEEVAALPSSGPSARTEGRQAQRQGAVLVHSLPRNRHHPDPSVHPHVEVSPSQAPVSRRAGPTGAEAPSSPGSGPGQGTEVRFRHSSSLPRVLSEAGCSLLISTYQAGQLVAVGVADGELTFSFRRFDRAMGVAVRADRIAVAGERQIWSLPDHSDARRCDRACRTLRQVLAATHVDRDRRRSSATRSPGGPPTRRAGPVDRQHPVLLPGRPRPSLQLRAALAATVHLRVGRTGPLPLERHGDARRIPGLRDRDGTDRLPERLAQRCPTTAAPCSMWPPARR